MNTRTFLIPIVTASLLACGSESEVPRAEAAELDAEVAEATSTLGARLDGLTRELEVLATEAGGRLGFAADSLRLEAREIRDHIGRLAEEAEDRSFAAERIGVRLDSMQRDLVVLRFRAADEIESFERTADAVVAELRTEMDRVGARIEAEGDSVAPEVRERFGRLRGELIELEAEMEALGETAADEGAEAFREARLTFARTVAEAGYELRRIAAEIDPDPPS